MVKRGQFYAAKYRGKGNGDLIIGQVASVRRDGIVVLDNLLTGEICTKARDILLSRNHLVNEETAKKIYFTKDKAAARELAVQSRTSIKPKKTPAQRTQSSNLPTRLEAYLSSKGF